MAEVVGESSTGKSQLCMLFAATTALRGEGVVYVDTAAAFSPVRVLGLCRALKVGREIIDGNSFRPILMILAQVVLDHTEPLSVRSRVSISGCYWPGTSPPAYSTVVAAQTRKEPGRTRTQPQTSLIRTEAGLNQTAFLLSS